MFLNAQHSYAKNMNSENNRVHMNFERTNETNKFVM